MRLWSDEVEALREEARRARDEHFASLDAATSDPPIAPGDAGERVRLAREGQATLYALVPEAEVRELAGVPCRVFMPPGPVSAVYLHFHGGGMIGGAPEMNDADNLRLSQRFGMAVVSVGYRLAPEHPFPAGPDDGVAVASWLLDHAGDELGTGRLLLGGESAGGYMAAAVLLRIRDELEAIERVDGANLVFGVYDWGGSPSQRGMRPSSGPDMLDVEGTAFFRDCYLPGCSADERRDPAISPAYADLSRLPPSLMSVGTCDHLVDDTLMLAGRWAAAEREVDLVVLPDMPHGFGAIRCEMSRAWIHRTRSWFDDILHRAPRAS